jgi:flagellar export protein FliJ
MRNPNRYAAILRIRERAEDREAQALAAIRAEIQRAQRQRTALELSRQSTLEQAGASLREHFDASDIRGYYQYERHVVFLRDQKDAEIRQLSVREAAQRAVLETATRERRVAEKLHERRWDAYRQFLRKEEQKFLDETATMYAARAGQQTGHGAKEEFRP